MSYFLISWVRDGLFGSVMFVSAFSFLSCSGLADDAKPDSWYRRDVPKKAVEKLNSRREQRWAEARNQPAQSLTSVYTKATGTVPAISKQRFSQYRVGTVR